MGIAIAEQLAKQGAQVSLVLGPTALTSTHPNVHVIKVQSAAQMYEACLAQFNDATITVMSAAVADYTPLSVANEKIKKKEDTFNIELTKTKDILKSLGAIKTDNQILVGFALESVDEKNYALKKLEAKNADIIVLNSVRDAGAGFGFDTNKVTLFYKDGNEKEFGLKTKQEVAQDIVQEIIELKNKKDA